MNEPEGHPLHVLVVDDNRSAAEAAALLLEREGHDVEVRFGGQQAIDCMAERPFDLVLTDLRMDDVDGLAVVRAARSSVPPVDAIVFTAYGSVEVAVEAMRLGAVDFLTKPVTASQLLRRVREYRSAPSTQPALVGESAAMTNLRASAVKLSRVGSTVLVVGETGTGRRHLARWLHYNGPDGDRELLRAQPGVPLTPDRLAQAGTILVPSVDTWTASAQLGLLRQLDALDAGQDVRVVATASPEAEQHVASGDLLPELYFRLAVLVVPIPPLRERPEDINPLLDHFLAIAGRAIGKPPPQLSLAVRVRLAQHDWPGNALQLANIAERAIVWGPSAFDFETREPIPPRGSMQIGDGFSLSDHMGEVERTLLVAAIEKTNGDRPAMSRLLGLERNTLRYKLNKYGLLDKP